MFNNLIESKPQRQRSTGGTFASVVFHTALITALVYVTANAGQQMREERREEEVKFIEVPKNEPPPPEPERPPPPEVVAAPPPPKGFQVLTAPVEIPDKLPEIDLEKAVTNEADFSGKGVAGGTAKGVEGGTPINQDQAYFEFQVEKPVLPREGNPQPRFPEMLRSGNVEGEVLVQFVVDTLGRVEAPSIKILKTTHKLFEDEVRRVLKDHKFYAAETGGRKVKQLVQQPFVFNLAR